MSTTGASADNQTEPGLPRYRAVGDSALLVEYALAIAPAINRQVRALLAALDATPPAGLRDLVPAYRTLLIRYDPTVITHAELLDRVRALEDASHAAAPPGRVVTVPVCYGGEYGPDLADVAAQTGLTTEEVVARHSAGHYPVYFLGFAPGFPYLGGLDASLATPRLPQPRPVVPAGAVGIGGEQTGIYSLTTPGGWRIIGRTPVRLYDLTAAEPFLLRAGDEVQFRPVTPEEYAAVSEAVAAGTYQPQIGAVEAR
ncbi:MAG: 5-oxoprolinase subunit PxpB [Thermomicrobiales bacterium]